MTTNGHPAPPRWQDLACDAALFGLDDAERAELDALDADAAALLDLELAAGEIAARAHEAHPEELPPALAEKLLERAPLARPAPEPHASEPRASASGPEPRASASGPDASHEPPVAAPRDPKVVSIARAAPGAEARREPPRDPEGRRPSPLPWLLAAAAILIALLGWLRQDTAPVTVTPPAPSASAPRPETPASAREALLAIAGTARVPWKTTADPSASGATGDVVWHNGVQHGYMHFHGLAANDPAKAQYQLWIFDEGRDEHYPVDGGVFDVGPDADVIVPIEPKLHVSKPTLFAITVEKPGGVVVSKRERIVLTASLPPT